MDIKLFLLSWSPVLALTVLAVLLRRSALELSIFGFLYSLGLSLWFFETPIGVIFVASLDGVLTTTPLLLVILTGVLLSSLLMATGSIKRIVEWFEKGAGDSFSRNLLITFGVGNFMEGSGVIAEPVVAPMLHAAGVSPAGSVALSIVGYSGLMTLELAGIIVTVLSLVTGLPVRELGIASAWLSVPATVAMALCAPIFLPEKGRGGRNLIQSLLTGILLSSVALVSAILLGISVSGTFGGLAVIFVFVALGAGGLEFNRETLIDLSPFLFMLVCLLSVNMIPFLHELTSKKLVVPISIIPGRTVVFSPLFSAYLYLLVAFLLSATLQKVPLPQLKIVALSSMKKGWRAFVSMGFFGAMGQIISYTGYGADFSSVNEIHNIPSIISKGLALYTGTYYPMFVPLLGWVGTFLTGYGVASLMLFGQLQIQAATILGVAPMWLAAGLAVGSSVGSISSPFKIALAAPLCGAIGQEGDILRWTIPLGIGASLLVGIVLWAFI